MKRAPILVALTALLLGLVGPVSSAGATHRVQVLRATMTGAEEVPPVETDAVGRALFLVDRDREAVRFIVFAVRIEGVTEAHVHLAPRGENGAPVAFLFDFDDEPLNVGTAEEGTRRGFVAAGRITQDDLLPADLTIGELIDALETGGAYVNVHTLVNRAGEIRGQIG